MRLRRITPLEAEVLEEDGFYWFDEGKRVVGICIVFGLRQNRVFDDFPSFLVWLATMKKELKL